MQQQTMASAPDSWYKKNWIHKIVGMKMFPRNCIDEASFKEINFL
jgi:hypothetical protein